MTAQAHARALLLRDLALGDPRWEVHDEGHHGEDECRVLRASSAQDAAERWAAISDRESADYTCVGGDPITVDVRRAVDGGDGPWTTLVVTGRTEAVYYAEPML